MTAFVTIPVATVDGVLKIPNTALRFMPPLPPDKIRALYSRYGVEAETSQEESGRATKHAAKREAAIVWKSKSGGGLQPVKIEIGITDHAYTQIVKVITGVLSEGDDVVTASLNAQTARR
jgi:HlyD family secretion protein